MFICVVLFLEEDILGSNDVFFLSVIFLLVLFLKIIGNWVILFRFLSFFDCRKIFFLFLFFMLMLTEWDLRYEVNFGI